MPEFEAFRSRKIILERRRGGAKFVTDIQLVQKPRGRLIQGWLRPRQRDHTTILAKLDELLKADLRPTLVLP